MAYSSGEFGLVVLDVFQDIHVENRAKFLVSSQIGKGANYNLTVLNTCGKLGLILAARLRSGSRHSQRFCVPSLIQFGCGSDAGTHFQYVTNNVFA